jgi:uncharacterized repeat protein (TIGR01451 family)
MKLFNTRFILLLFMGLYFMQSKASVTVATSSTNACTNDGAATAVASGGVAPYAYVWSNGATTPTITGLSKGWYCVTVMDNAGASTTSCVSIQSIVQVSKTMVNEVCPPGNNGELTANPTGGAAPYTYLWSNGNTNPHLSGLISEEVYSLNVTVTDANGCIGRPDSSSQFTPTFGYQIYDTPAICPSTTGKLSSSVWGGTPPYSYLWSNGSTTSYTVATLGQHYHVTITDANGCQATQTPWSKTDSIKQQSLFYPYCTNTNEVCNNGAGTITTSIGGTGSAPYTYHWSSGQVTQNITGLHQGSYSVTVTASNGCSAIGNGNVYNSSPIIISISNIPEQCGNGVGSLTAVANSGTAPYTFHWSTGATTQSITGLHQGSYGLTVTDATGCTSQNSGYISNNSPISANGTQLNESCNNGAGWAKVAPSLGTAPYSYLWNTGQTTAQINGLSTGSYIVTIQDAVGCVKTQSFYISNTSPIAPHGTYTAPTCSNLNGTATVAPSGGTAPYTYLWNTVPPSNTASVSGLGVGSYTCQITDANGCVGAYYAYLPYNSTLNVNVSNSNVVCPNTNGTANVTISGGTLPYTLHWSTGSTAASISGLAAGFYTITVKDANNCIAVKDLQVISYSPLHVNLSHSNATCIFDNDGTATATVTGGTAPYAYQWQNGQTTPTSTGLTPTWQYGVYVTDANGCSGHNWTNIAYNNTHCAVDICGYVIEDKNGNCIWETGEYGIPNVLVHTLPGGYSYTDAYGHFSNLQPTGNFTIQQIIPSYFNQICPNPNPVINASIADSQYCNNFYDHAIDTVDMRISWNYLTPPRPGFTSEIELYAFNDGIRAVNDSIIFNYDANMVFSSASATPIFLDAVAHKVIFSCNSAGHGSINSYRLYFSIPSTTPLGTLVNCTGSVGGIKLLAKDPTPLNNVEARTTEVVGSYDPNDKSVTPLGVGVNGIIQRSDSLLNYTVRFQNTGTFKAQNVVIADTLDADLDVTSIKPGSSSHPYTLEFRGERILLIKFLNINLPDSNADEKGSHGMVNFYIKTKKNLPDGTQFKNTAAIYFDYNAPVITNTTTNSLVMYNGIRDVSDNSMRLYPNPATDIVTIETDLQTTESAMVFDNMGRKMGEVVLSPNTKNRIDISKLADGIYFVRMNAHAISGSFMKVGK